MFIRAGHEELPIGRDQVARHEAVDRETEWAHEVPDPAAERQPADSGMGDDATGYREPEGLALMVDVAPQTTALSLGGLRDRVDPHPGHRREVDDQPPSHTRPATA
jgi:hypothetical protein